MGFEDLGEKLDDAIDGARQHIGKRLGLLDDPEFYTREEGGTFRKWEPRIRGIVVYSLCFPDGRQWDSYLGWTVCDIEAIRKHYDAAKDV